MRYRMTVLRTESYTGEIEMEHGGAPEAVPSELLDGWVRGGLEQQVNTKLTHGAWVVSSVEPIK